MSRTIIGLSNNTFSLQFNGTSSVVSLGSSGPVSVAATAFTLEAIVCFEKTGTTQTIIGNTSVSVEHFYWQINPDMRLASYCQTSGLVGAHSGGQALVPGQFYKLHLIYNGSSLIQYIDAIVDQTTACTGTVTPTSSSTIGRGYAGGRHFKGNIKLIRYWNRALSASEVRARVEDDNNSSSIRTGLVAEWLFQNGSGSSLVDTVGTDNGTISNATWSYKVPSKRRQQVGPSINAYPVNFNGSTQKISVANVASINPTSQATGLVWFYPRAFTATSSILINKSLNGVTNSYYLSLGGKGELLLYFEIGGVSRNLLTSEQRVIPNEWNLVGFCYNGVDLRTIVYNSQLRGISTAALAATGSIGTNTDPLIIGTSSNGSFGQANGFIFRPRIWNQSLTIDQLDSLFYEFGHVSTGCVLDLQMLESSGLSAVDASGNGNNGVLVNNSRASSTFYSQRQVASGRQAAAGRLSVN